MSPRDPDDAIEGREAFIVSRRIPNRRFYGMPNNFIEAELGIAATTRNRSTLIRIAERARREQDGARSPRKSR